MEDILLRVILLGNAAVTPEGSILLVSDQVVSVPDKPPRSWSGTLEEAFILTPLPFSPHELPIICFFPGTMRGYTPLICGEKSAGPLFSLENL